jgi:hypothetical protein
MSILKWSVVSPCREKNQANSGAKKSHPGKSCVPVFRDAPGAAECDSVGNGCDWYHFGWKNCLKWSRSCWVIFHRECLCGMGAPVAVLVLVWLVSLLVAGLDARCWCVWRVGSDEVLVVWLMW